jgi:hypothetical protein
MVAPPTPIEFPVDCLVGMYTLPVVYYVAGWTLFSMSKATTIAADNRPVCFSSTVVTPDCNTLLMGPSMILTTFFIWSKWCLLEKLHHPSPLHQTKPHEQAHNADA